MKPDFHASSDNSPSPRLWSNRLTVAAILVALVNFGFEWDRRNRENRFAWLKKNNAELKKENAELKKGNAELRQKEREARRTRIETERDFALAELCWSDSLADENRAEEAWGPVCWRDCRVAMNIEGL